MKDADDREAVLTALASAPVVRPIVTDIKTGTRSGAAIETVELEGEIKALFKRGDVDPPGLVGVRREVAAYRVARMLSWEDLLPATALRRVPVANGSEVEIAAIELFLDRGEDADLGSFTADEINRAGVIDALIGNPDRGHNWLLVPAKRGRLKLIDHELAFADMVVNSEFWKSCGETVAVDLRAAVSAFNDEVADDRVLKLLLTTEEHQRLVARAAAVRSTY